MPCSGWEEYKLQRRHSVQNVQFCHNWDVHIYVLWDCRAGCISAFSTFCEKVLLTVLWVQRYTFCEKVLLTVLWVQWYRLLYCEVEGTGNHFLTQQHIPQHQMLHMWRSGGSGFPSYTNRYHTQLCANTQSLKMQLCTSGGVQQHWEHIMSPSTTKNEICWNT
jgi:hypothetical protein